MYDSGTRLAGSSQPHGQLEIGIIVEARASDATIVPYPLEWKLHGVTGNALRLTFRPNLSVHARKEIELYVHFNSFGRPVIWTDNCYCQRKQWSGRIP
jgi:hypothetical protein